MRVYNVLTKVRIDAEQRSKKNSHAIPIGVIHNKANTLDQTNWETGSMNSQSSLNSFASSAKSASTHRTGSTVTIKKHTDEEEALRGGIFTEIQDLKKEMKNADEPHEIALKVARLYVELALQKLSIPFFVTASKVVPYHTPRVHPQEQEKVRGRARS